MPHSSSINKQTENDDTPEKSMKVKKKKIDNTSNDDEINSLPPIHQLRLDVKLNLYGATTKTQDNVFKKTLASIGKKKEEYVINGINGKKMDRWFCLSNFWLYFFLLRFSWFRIRFSMVLH